MAQYTRFFVHVANQGYAGGRYAQGLNAATGRLDVVDHVEKGKPIEVDYRVFTGHQRPADVTFLTPIADTSEFGGLSRKLPSVPMAWIDSEGRPTWGGNDGDAFNEQTPADPSNATFTIPADTHVEKLRLQFDTPCPGAASASCAAMPRDVFEITVKDPT